MKYGKKLMVVPFTEQDYQNLIDKSDPSDQIVKQVNQEFIKNKESQQPNLLGDLVGSIRNLLDNYESSKNPYPIKPAVLDKKKIELPKIDEQIEPPSTPPKMTIKNRTTAAMFDSFMLNQDPLNFTENKLDIETFDGNEDKKTRRGSRIRNKIETCNQSS